MDLKKIEEQVRDNMRLAWKNIIQEKIRTNPPDFNYIVILYKEMKHKITHIIKKDSTRYKEIDEKLDEKLFEQMIKNDAFTRADFLILVNYVFNLCISLGSPSRDKDTNIFINELCKDINTEYYIYTVIPNFFLKINICIDWIYEDLGKLVNQSI